jgi:hypothetical protein
VAGGGSPLPDRARPLPEVEEWLLVARCVGERLRGIRQPGEYLDGMTEDQCLRVEQIIHCFAHYDEIAC